MWVRRQSYTPIWTSYFLFFSRNESKLSKSKAPAITKIRTRHSRNRDRWVIVAVNWLNYCRQAVAVLCESTSFHSHRKNTWKSIIRADREIIYHSLLVEAWSAPTTALTTMATNQPRASYSSSVPVHTAEKSKTVPWSAGFILTDGCKTGCLRFRC
jgi:hypothetical protein